MPNKTRSSYFILFLFISLAGFSQSNIVATAAGAKIQQAIALTEVKSMHFGTMTVNASQGGTCVLTPEGQRYKTGGVTLQNLYPLMSTGTYSVTGEPGRSYSILLPSTITVSSAPNSMTVNNLLAKPTNSTASHTAVGAIGAGGSDQFTLGATLNVAASQPEGLYSGTFTVTVTYN